MNKNTFMNNFFIVLLKELKYTLKSKKTLLYTILVPILFIPFLLSVLSNSIDKMERNTSKNINITVNDKNNRLYDYLSQIPDITVVEKENTTKSPINIIIPQNFDQSLSLWKIPEVIIEGDDSSSESQIAIAKINEYIKSYSKSYTQQYLSQNGIPDKILEPIQIKMKGEKKKLNLMNIILPMFLLLYCCVGSTSTATDLSAGEKEKYTLEPVLSTKSNRTSIVLGKLAATSIVGCISGLSTVLGMIGYNTFSSQDTLTIQQMFLLLGVIIMSSILFAAINLSIGIYSRNYKEAQTFMSSLSLIVLIPTYLLYGIDIHDLTIQQLSTPILNIVCLIKEILAGVFILNHILIVSGWVALYILLFSILSVKLFNREEVVFRI